MRWALTLLGISIVVGTIVRSVGICISQFIRSTDVPYKHLLSQKGAEILAELDPRFNEVLSKVIDPFVGPLRWWMNYSLKESTKDLIRTEKSFVRVVSWQLYAFALQAILAATAIIVLAVNIKNR